MDLENTLYFVPIPIHTDDKFTLVNHQYELDSNILKSVTPEEVASLIYLGA